MASQEVLRLWSIDLESQTESHYYTQFFDPTWKQYATNRGTVIGSDQSVDFMRAYLNSVSSGQQESPEEWIKRENGDLITFL